MSDDPPKAIVDLLTNSVTEGVTLFAGVIAAAKSQADAEPEAFSAEVILQTVWHQLTEHFIAQGWTQGELIEKLINGT